MPPLRAVRGKSWTWFKILPLFYQETYMDESSAGSFVFPMSLFQSFAVIPPLIPKICSLEGWSSILRLEKNALCGRI